MDPENSALGDEWMRRDHRLHRAGRETVPRHVDDIVSAAHDVEVAVIVEVSAVAARIEAGVLSQVARHVALVVAPEGRQGSGRQWQPDDDRALLMGGERRTLLIEDMDVIAGYRHGRRTRLDGHRMQAAQIRGDRPAGLGLPPVVDDWDLQVLRGPVVGIRVESLAREEQGTERTDVGAANEGRLGVLALDCPDRGRSREQPVHPVVLDHPPEGSSVGRANRLALEHDARRPGYERRVHDVGVPDHPAHIGRRPPDIVRAHAIDVRERPGHRDRVPAVVAHHALRPAGRAGRVEDVERVGRPNWDGRPRHRHRHGLVPVKVQWPHRRDARRTLQDDDAIGCVRREGDSRIDEWLVFDNVLRFDPARGSHDYLRHGIVDSCRELLGSEPPEYDRVHRADPSAGKHRDSGLRDHRQVDDHSIARCDAKVVEDSGECGDLTEQFAIGDCSRCPGHRAHMVDCRAITPTSFDMAVECIPAGVERGVREPPVKRGPVVVEHTHRTALPIDKRCRLAPERGGIRPCPLLRLLVCTHPITVSRALIPSPFRARSSLCVPALPAAPFR